MTEYNHYPKNLEGFILLEKLKEQEAQKKMKEYEDFQDFMEPVPLSLDDKGSGKSNASTQEESNKFSYESPKATFTADEKYIKA